MRKFVYILSVFFLFQLHLAAQRNCASMDVLEEELVKDPSLKIRMDEIERQTNEFIKKSGREKGSRGVITIPVVFHVLYKTTAENISTAQLQSQLDVLNQDFRYTNADKSLIPGEFSGLASDIEVEFCLATQNPNGQATTGIERKQTSVTSWGTSNNVKLSNKGGLNAWTASKYLNIWVCNIGNNILGYATFPGGNASLDGVVIDYRYIGTTGTATAPFNKGRTATHEVAHWLNLRHIWGDATCGSDFVSDTPVHYTSNYACPTHPKSTSCSGGNEMFMNYMDYVDDACMYMFTAGQKTRMRAVLDTGGARSSLASSPGCLPPGTVACNAPSSISSSNVTSVGATVSWSAVTGASSYSFEYKLSTASTWTVLPVNTTSYTLNNLTPSTAYDVRVRATCSSTNGSYSTTLNVTTAAPVVCSVPANLTATNILSSSATISWSAVSGATYVLQYKTNAAATWTSLNTSTATANLTGLSPSTMYNMQVAAVCSGSQTAFSTQVNFTTAPVSTTCSDNFDTNTTNNNTKSKSSSITPGTTISAKISTSTDVDWYKFNNTSSAKNVKVTMSNLPADYDMILYRSSTQVGISENDGLVNEVVIHNNTLIATTYYVYIYPYAGAFSNTQCYNLLAQISSSNLTRLGAQGQEEVEEFIEWEEVKDEFMAFPNPTDGELTLMLPFGKQQQGQVRIADLTGKDVYTENFTGSNETRTVILDVSSLNNGVYLIHFTNGQNISTRKIVIAQRQ